MISFDGRIIVDETINWRRIKEGDVVLEGDVNQKYRTLTKVDGKNWEYLNDDGYFSGTSPEYCHWLVIGQKGCRGSKLINIDYDN